MITYEIIKDALYALHGVDNRETGENIISFMFGPEFFVFSDSKSVLVCHENSPPDEGVIFQFYEGAWRALGNIKEVY
jgi:hypothetical protein